MDKIKLNFKDVCLSAHLSPYTYTYQISGFQRRFIRKQWQIQGVRKIFVLGARPNVRYFIVPRPPFEKSWIRRWKVTASYYFSKTHFVMASHMLTLLRGLFDFRHILDASVTILEQARPTFTVNARVN